MPNFDYSTPGVYFITICSKERKCIFWDTVGASIARPHAAQLSACGRVVDKAIKNIPSHYSAISVDHYLKIWEYIDNNPAKWEEDCFYTT